MRKDPAPWNTAVSSVMALQLKRALTILRLKQVLERTRLSSSSVFNRMNPRSKYYDPFFPKSISLGGSAKGWIEAELDAWILGKRGDISPNESTFSAK